jgi:uncharacterized membrane protein required for colicin V production
MNLVLQEAAAPRPFWSFFTDLAWVDRVGMIVIVIFMLLGVWRGMWWQIVRFLGVIMSIALARSLAPSLQPTLAKVTGGTDAVTHGVAWFSIFLGGLVVATLFGMLGKKTLEAMQLGLIDRVGGAVVGALTGVVIHGALLILACSLTSTQWYESNLGGTRSAQALAQVSQYQLGPLHAEAKEKIFHWGERFQEGAGPSSGAQ